jgi:hypothetical protein
MKRLSILIWLALFTATLPLLALPLWLMKTAIISLALIMAGIVYSLLRQSRTAVSGLKISTPKDKPTSQPKADRGKQPPEKESDSDKEPLDVTNPEADRFVATNTFKNRQDRLRN